MNINKVIGQRVLLSRRDLGLQQQEVAEMASISRSFVSNIEHGRAKNISAEILFALAQALEVRVEYLLGLSDVAVGEGDEEPLHGPGTRAYYDARTAQEREMIETLITEFQKLSESDQELILGMMEVVKRKPRIIGDEP